MSGRRASDTISYWRCPMSASAGAAMSDTIRPVMSTPFRAVWPVPQNL